MVIPESFFLLKLNPQESPQISPSKLWFSTFSLFFSKLSAIQLAPLESLSKLPSKCRAPVPSKGSPQNISRQLTNGLTQLPLSPALQLPSSTVFSFFCWKKSPRVKLPLAIKTTNLIPYQPVLEWHVVIPDDDTCHNLAVEMSPQNGGLQ